jgi:hypothetical protein
MKRSDVIQLHFLSGRCRMGDPRAQAICKRILAGGMRLPPGHPGRLHARCLSQFLNFKRFPRAAFLPPPRFRPTTNLGARLCQIFQAAGGCIHLRAGA